MLKKIFITISFILILSGKVLAQDFSADMTAISPMLGSPEMQAYSLEVGKKIIKNFDLPTTDENFATFVTFKVDKNGKLISYEITQTSGNTDYDNRVINAIKKSSPYPPPSFQEGEEIGVILNMDMNILKLIKMLENFNLDFNFDSNLVPEDLDNLLSPKEYPAPKNNTKPPSGKKFVNPYDIEKSLE